jgi:hypothetical protein
MDSNLIARLEREANEHGHGYVHDLLREAAAALRGAEDAPASDKWQKAALRLGEELASSSGPTGYYAFTPEQWLQWALGEARASASSNGRCACGNRTESSSDRILDVPEDAF